MNSRGEDNVWFPLFDPHASADSNRLYLKNRFEYLAYKKFKKRLAKKIIKRKHLTKVPFIKEYRRLVFYIIGYTVSEQIILEGQRESFSRKIFTVGGRG